MVDLLEWCHRWHALRMTVCGQSMEPAYVEGSRVVVGQFAYLRSAPARGEVVVIRSPEASGRWELKRIIGLPHEEVAWISAAFWINGALLKEPYARIPSSVPGDDERRCMRLGAREYFVAGDHRLYSRDSRHYGAVSRAALLGRVIEPSRRLGSADASLTLVTRCG